MKHVCEGTVTDMFLESRPTLFSDLAALSVASGAHLEHCADPPIPAVAGWMAGIHRRTHSHAHTHLRDSNQPTVYVFGLWEGTGENPHRPWENMQTPHVTYSVRHRWEQRIGIPPGNFRCIFKSFFFRFYWTPKSFLSINLLIWFWLCWNSIPAVPPTDLLRDIYLFHISQVPPIRAPHANNRSGFLIKSRSPWQLQQHLSQGR